MVSQVESLGSVSSIFQISLQHFSASNLQIKIDQTIIEKLNSYTQLRDAWHNGNYKFRERSKLIRSTE
jgi:hypothetical protein